MNTTSGHPMKKLIMRYFLCLTTIVASGQINKEVFEFEYENTVLNGVLNTPKNKIPKGLVLMVHGSGQTNSVAQEWHYDIRAQFVKSGYAVYMWDKMGCGKSGGAFDYNQSVQSSAQEAIAAIKALQQKQIPGAEEIGLWGISRGGWINPLIINQYDGIKFWVSVSGVDDKENFKYLLAENLRINGHPKDTVQLLVDELQEGVRLTHTGESYETYLAATKNIRKNDFLTRFNNGTSITEEGYYAYQKSFMKETLDKASGLVVYVKDFEKILANVDCPVLALFGEKDMNVDWTKTKTLYESTLGRNTALTIASFPDCNHNMFKCDTGGFYEIQDDKLPWDRCDGVIDTMANWLLEMEQTTNTPKMP